MKLLYPFGMLTSWTVFGFGIYFEKTELQSTSNFHMLRMFMFRVASLLHCMCVCFCCSLCRCSNMFNHLIFALKCAAHTTIILSFWNPMCVFTMCTTIGTTDSATNVITNIKIIQKPILYCVSFFFLLNFWVVYFWKYNQPDCMAFES